MILIKATGELFCNPLFCIFLRRLLFFWQYAIQLIWRKTMRQGAIRVWSVRLLLALASLLLVGAVVVWFYVRESLPMLDGTVTAPALQGTVTVARDAYGVPLVSGTHRNDLAYATGFIHAQDRFFQMDLLRRVGAGELSELFGPKALPTDKAHRLHRFRARAAQAVKAMTADERRMLDTYVAGVNDGLKALRARPFEYVLVGATPRPWRAEDSVLVVYAMYFDLQGKLLPRELARGWMREQTTPEQRALLMPETSAWDVFLDGPTPASIAPIPAMAPEWWGKPAAPVGDKLARLDSADFVDSVGSNNWAVAGSRSKSGAAIVADDMHLGLQLPNIWYRVALQYPDAQGKMRRVAGVTLPGALPTVVVGSNGHVAWGYTNSYGDYLDLMVLETADDKPGQVRTQAGWETPVVHEEVILVKGAKAVKLRVRETSFGPVHETMGRQYALHWTAHSPQALNANPVRMEAVQSVEEALALGNTLGIPAQNMVAGDRAGNIGWTIAGMLPHRAQADVGVTYPIEVDGKVVTFDGSLPTADYPRLVNPANGQLSTANSRQLAGAGADKIGDGGFDIGARNKQVHDGLVALGGQTDIAGVYGVALDDRALFIVPWRERLLKVLDADAVKGKPLRAEFLAQVKDGWTGRASVDSTGYHLARQFMWSMHDLFYGQANTYVAKVHDKATMAMVSSRWPAVLARLLDEQPKGWLPPGQADWRAVQLAAVDRAIADLTKDGKTLGEATWGRRNTSVIAHPITAGVPFLKRWLAVPNDGMAGDANMPRVAGPKFGQSERLTVSPGQEESGLYNMPGGQSGHPLSPYFQAGHAEWVKGMPLPLLPGKAEHTLTFKK